MAEIGCLRSKKNKHDLKVIKCVKLRLTRKSNSLLYPSTPTRGGEIGRRGGLKIRCQR